MAWVKDRENLHIAAISSAKAISKNRDLASKNTSSNRSPNLGEISLTSAPRSSAKINAWRGEGDFQAFWNLYHQDLKELPLTKEAREIFKELELSRVEILGGNKFKGAKKNMSSYINTKSSEIVNEKIQNQMPFAVNLWLKSVVGYQFEGSAQEIVDNFKKLFFPEGNKDLEENFIKNLSDQAAFEKESLKLLSQLNLLKEHSNDSMEESDEESPGSMEQNDSDLSDSGMEIESENISETTDLADEIDDDLLQEASITIEDKSIEEEIELSGSYTDIVEEQTQIPYSIYTNKYDEVIEAKDLSTREEALRLRNQLDHLIKPHLTTIGKLANRLQRLLLSKQNTSWNFNLEEGVLDTARLSRVVTEPGAPLSFKEESEKEFKNTVVTLLIDSSGSMRGRSISLAAICADIIGSTLERCSIKTEVLGFTTKNWKGGESKKLWQAQGSPVSPGRLNDIRHIIFKNADNSWRRARKYFGVMLREGLLKENIDGEALSWSFQRLLKRPEERKILIVVSDGAPVDDSTLSTNHSLFLDDHLRTIISSIEEGSKIELLAIGIGHDVSKYYKRAITIHRAEELGEVLLQELSELFKN
ncbi:cobalt chelatase [Gammaproteobacteria bacterium]|jgi:cobaltochelatase CobT|nr:cobalt chelatase [Gammaproteobacteria bacterium]|tara:strand:+ start:6111 stop:7877 length:1767 start_codon:yes stop_codon:yes gene_type:complete